MTSDPLSHKIEFLNWAWIGKVGRMEQEEEVRFPKVISVRVDDNDREKMLKGYLAWKKAESFKYRYCPRYKISEFVRDAILRYTEDTLKIKEKKL